MGEPDTESHSVAGVFDLARRGYDPRQVDDHLQNLLVQLSEAERARRREESRANRAESELVELRERLRAGTGERPAADEGGDEGRAASTHEGFGLRVEKLLRAAEQEAAETREGATREAAELLEQARVDADTHRREQEQSLSSREAEVDRKAVRRTVELDERERQVTEQSVLAREEADRLLADARSRAEALEADARSHAAQHWAENEKAVEERRTAADDELDRLRGVRRGVRGDLARMLATLAGELERPDVETARAGAVDPALDPTADAAVAADLPAADLAAAADAARTAAAVDAAGGGEATIATDAATTATPAATAPASPVTAAEDGSSARRRSDHSAAWFAPDDAVARGDGQGAEGRSVADGSVRPRPYPAAGR